MTDYIDGLPLDDKITWDLFCKGYTQGIFQLESHLARSTLRKVRPRNIGDLSDVMALIRPGALKQIDEYLAVRNIEKEVEYIEPKLSSILNETNGIILYQEQTLSIAQKLAGFSESKSDELRAAIGKKKKEKMDKLLPEFIDGCVKNGVKRKNAQVLADIIIESSSYSFNKSHSMSYALNSFITAYYKANNPISFFWANLITSKMKPDQLEEIRNIYYDMKNFNLELMPPSLKNKSPEFKVVDNRSIEFGLNYIKGCGEKSFAKLQKIADFDTWAKVFKGIIENNISKSHYEPIIKCGALDHLGVPRYKMLLECEFIKSLSKTQLDAFKLLFNPIMYGYGYIEDIMGNVLLSNKRLKMSAETKEILKKIKLKQDYPDHPITKDIYERSLLGINLTSSRIESYDTDGATSSCKDCNDQISGHVCVVGLLEKVNIIKTKKGDKMAFLEISDISGKIGNVVVFPDLFLESYYKNNILKRVESEILRIVGYKKESSLICKSIEELS